MKNIFFLLSLSMAIGLLGLLSGHGPEQNRPQSAAVCGRQILVEGIPFFMKGIGYAPTPLCQDPSTMLPNGDYFTPDYQAIYNRDLPLVRQMGANTLRLWCGWKDDAKDHADFLTKAYNNNVNPLYVVVTFWIDPQDYPNLALPEVRNTITENFRRMVAKHKSYPGVLMWAIGNELNAPWMFGDQLPALFALIDEMAEAAHLEEGTNFRPVTTPLADIDLINTISTYDSLVPHLDVWSVQVYRGISFGTLFSDYQKASGKPLVILEYGIDAYDHQHKDEYELIGTPYQANYDRTLWKEMEANSGVCSGGSIMAYSDEWWKGKHGNGNPGCPDMDPCFHGICGSPAGSHPDGYANEEWWGIMRTKGNGIQPDIMEPRAAYFAMKSIWAAGKRDDFIGTWDGQGVYYRNSDSGNWVKLSTPASLIASGDLDGDAIADLIGIWPAQGGVWVRYSQLGTWARICSTAKHIGAGDMNGDGWTDLVGTWDGQGVYYRSSATGSWIKMATPAELIAAGDLDGDGHDDLIGIWADQGGVWAKLSKSGSWMRLSSAARDIAAGDMNGDGKDDLLAAYDGQGVFFRNSADGSWVKVATPADQVACGDLDGDGKGDLIGVWQGQGGVWVKYSAKGAWTKLSSTAKDIGAARMRAAGSPAREEAQGLFSPFGGYASGPETAADPSDVSSIGPGFSISIPSEERLSPQATDLPRIPGPGESGFRWTEQKNLIPEERAIKIRVKRGRRQLHHER